MSNLVLIGDSGIDLNLDNKNKMGIRTAPFPITVEQKEFIDDEHLIQSDLLAAIRESKQKAQTAAPSPGQFLRIWGENSQDGFIVTISSKLSASYSNAVLAARDIMEQCGNRVHVFDSKSAAAGEGLLATYLHQCIKEGQSYEEIVANGEQFISEMTTYFVLEDLSTLVKAGRIPKLAGKIVQTLSINLICQGICGEIKVQQVTRGMKSALKKLAQTICANVKSPEKRTLFITHINCLQRAKDFAQLVTKNIKFKNIEIVDGSGLSSVYANDGGIVVAY